MAQPTKVGEIDAPIKEKTKTTAKTKTATKEKTSKTTKAVKGETTAKKATTKSTTAKKAEPTGKLVIVESPAKASTIGKFLGKGYSVVASVGHVCDLPKSTLGVDVENNFMPKYLNVKGKAETINAIKKKAKTATQVFLATDPDREGEAISWHLANLLKLDTDNACRIVFNEITPTAIKNAIATPRKIDISLVDAQQARRILDRLVGYKISPILWSKVKRGLSAGRVQSVATRIVVDREEEIRNFVPEEYWNITAKLKTAKGQEFDARFHGKNGKKIARVKCKKEADAILEGVKDCQYIAKDVKEGEKTRHPTAPFTTSSLQQESARKLGSSTKITMSNAQQLYEGAGTGAGLVTYIRTDSVRVSQDALGAVRDFINAKYGDSYLPEKANVYKGKKGAQDAHEAIRPTHLEQTPESLKARLTPGQYKLYKLIYDRFVASQMMPAKYATVSVNIGAGEYDFRATGSRVLFEGFMKVYTESLDEAQEKEGALPKIAQNDIFDLANMLSEQKFTMPPARYTEATLVKTLEEKGIGRPSTYAPTITTIIDRNYVKRDKKNLFPTELGEHVTEIMKSNFSNIVDVDFTAHMEEELDSIEEGNKTYPEVLKEFYTPFAITLEEAEKTLVRPEDEISDVPCDKCGAMMVIKDGRYGKFLACPSYPECKNTKEIGAPVDVPEVLCEKCGAMMELKTGRFGRFFACPNYPECKNTQPFEKGKTIDVPCPKCGGTIVEKKSKRGKIFYGCKNYPDCDFVAWNEPIEEKCPDCGGLMTKKLLKAGEEIACTADGCKYKRKLDKPKEDNNE